MTTIGCSEISWGYLGTIMYQSKNKRDCCEQQMPKSHFVC